MMKEIQCKGQLDIFTPVLSNGCSECVCRICFHYWKGDCPKGGCYDDYRAIVQPYKDTHGGIVRKAWSGWDLPGEQGHWCRGGSTYRQAVCDTFVRYEGQKIQQCLFANVSVFQDRSIRCSLVDSVGCEECYKKFMEEN